MIPSFSSIFVPYGSLSVFRRSKNAGSFTGFGRPCTEWFPPSGKTPDLLFFSAPQYNTWIELTYHQNEKDILAYAQSMLDNGLPPEC